MIDDTFVPEVPRRKVLDVLLKVTLVGWLGSVVPRHYCTRHRNC